MQQMKLDRNWPRAEDRRYTFSQTLSNSVSEPLRVPALGREVAVGVRPGTSARIEYTLGSYAAIEADSAEWYSWPVGDVTQNTSEVVSGSVTALRMVSVGEGTWEVSL